tara:strand:+ start:2656 stop:2985 length:330 start_codon:yes stop_codon:yes gene_type:complete
VANAIDPPLSDSLSFHARQLYQMYQAGVWPDRNAAARDLTLRLPDRFDRDSLPALFLFDLGVKPDRVQFREPPSNFDRSTHPPQESAWFFNVICYFSGRVIESSGLEVI